MNDEKLVKLIKDTIKEYSKTSAFTDRKLTDNPTDALSVVNRKFVTLNGTTTQRPASSIVGQSYLDMTLATGKGQPVWWNGSGWIDSAGNYV